MRKVSSVTVAMIMGIALYFTLFWGFDALRVLTSPTYGLEDVWRSQFVFGIGRTFGLTPLGLMQLAAFFGVVKLAVAVICAVHIADRFRSQGFRNFGGGQTNSEILEGGLILVVLVSIASAGPAVLSHNGDLVREQAIQLALAALAVALCMVERNYRTRAELAASGAAPIAADVPPATPFSPLR